MLRKAIEAGLNINVVDCVVGPKTGATKLAEFMAEAITTMRGRLCRWAAPKKGATEDADMSWDDPDHIPRKGDVVLMCEDVLSTGGSVKKAEKASISVGAEPLRFIVVIVNRSNQTEVFSKRIVALVEPTVHVWSAEECVPCKAGSKPIKDPKDHWTELTS